MCNQKTISLNELIENLSIEETQRFLTFFNISEILILGSFSILYGYLKIKLFLHKTNIFFVFLFSYIRIWIKFS